MRSGNNRKNVRTHMQRRVVFFSVCLKEISVLYHFNTAELYFVVFMAACCKFLCLCVVDRAVPKKLQRGVFVGRNWHLISVIFWWIASQRVFLRSCDGECAVQTIKLKTLWSVAFVVFSSGGWVPSAPLTFTKYSLYIGNLTHWGRGHLNCLNARSRGF